MTRGLCEDSASELPVSSGGLRSFVAVQALRQEAARPLPQRAHRRRESSACALLFKRGKISLAPWFVCLRCSGVCFASVFAAWAALAFGPVVLFRWRVLSSGPVVLGFVLRAPFLPCFFFLSPRRGDEPRTVLQTGITPCWGTGETGIYFGSSPQVPYPFLLRDFVSHSNSPSGRSHFRIHSCCSLRKEPRVCSQWNCSSSGSTSQLQWESGRGSHIARVCGKAISGISSLHVCLWLLAEFCTHGWSLL